MAEQTEKEQGALDAGRTPEEENRKESEQALREAEQEPKSQQAEAEEGYASNAADE
ncbi:MAG: hypothetical protein K2N94_08220 [Lachnospiraceae bacterium]|nr:hypothetical protein [Lachnospiraceae bacterium]